MDESPPLKVVTFLWTDPRKNPAHKHNAIYKPEHVERLARGVRRNLSVPYEFVLITDHDPKLFTEPDRIIPLWPDYREMGGCYVRLKLFSETMLDLIGPRILMLDLDTIVVGSIDHIPTRKVEFAMWASRTRRNPYCGAMMLMDAGARRGVWHNFEGAKSVEKAKRYLGTDQAWIARYLGEEEPTFDDVHGIYSYKWHVCGYDELPENACLIMFHGPYDPAEATEPWAKEHWV